MLAQGHAGRGDEARQDREVMHYSCGSLTHTCVSGVRPDCSSTRTRPAKRSLTDHMKGSLCISKQHWLACNAISNEKAGQGQAAVMSVTSYRAV